jgi:6,7-dimethyl-8-ribityllumazine synthase
VVELHGTSDASGCRFAIVVSHYNEDVTRGLLGGAMHALSEAGVSDEDVVVLHVPGAFEIPLTARRAAETGRFDAVICLGCVIKGDTMHFEFIAGAATQGIAQVATATGVPMAFGVLTTLTEEQARERAGRNTETNKGYEAAQTAVVMATLMRQLATFQREART